MVIWSGEFGTSQIEDGILRVGPTSGERRLVQDICTVVTLPGCPMRPYGSPRSGKSDITLPLLCWYLVPTPTFDGWEGSLMFV